MFILISKERDQLKINLVSFWYIPI